MALFSTGIRFGDDARNHGCVKSHVEEVDMHNPPCFLEVALDKIRSVLKEKIWARVVRRLCGR